MSMIKVDNTSYEKEILGDSSFKLLMVGAQWCGHCKAMKPLVEEYSRANPDIKLCYADADEAENITEKFEISSIPCFIAFKDKKEQERHIGGMSMDEFSKMIKKYF